jgi:hypothetical protein
MNTPVSPKLDKLLLDMGIDMPVSPTISDVIMWIYEKHEIWIQVKPGGKLETWDFIVQKKDNTFAVSYFEIKQHKPFFNSPTEAYEAAIEYTLNNLI